MFGAAKADVGEHGGPVTGQLPPVVQGTRNSGQALGVVLSEEDKRDPGRVQQRTGSPRRPDPAVKPLIRLGRDVDAEDNGDGSATIRVRSSTVAPGTGAWPPTVG